MYFNAYDVRSVSDLTKDDRVLPYLAVNRRDFNDWRKVKDIDKAVLGIIPVTLIDNFGEEMVIPYRIGMEFFVKRG